MIVPTRRLVVLAALAAPVALVVALWRPAEWTLGLLTVVLPLVLAAADLLLAVRPAAVRVRAQVPPAVGVDTPFEIGVDIEAPLRLFRIEVAVDESPLLHVEGGHLRTVAVEDGRAVTAFPAIAHRRGRAELARLWTRWTGPLGLVAFVREAPAALAISILPDVRAVTRAAQQGRADLPQGARAQPLVGEGQEFEALAEYRPGMDRRAIDWKQSARHTTLLAREYRLERNNTLLLAVDSGRAMTEPIDGAPRVDRAIAAALLAAYVALKAGDRVGLFAFDSAPGARTEPVAGAGAFPHLQRAAASIDYSSRETNFTLGLSTLAGRLNRRALVVIFTEITDGTGAELMLNALQPLLRRHLVLFVVFKDAELDALTDREPQNADDVTRAVAAHRLQIERRLVLARLRRRGAEVLEADHRTAGAALVDDYLRLKLRGRL